MRLLLIGNQDPFARFLALDLIADGFVADHALPKAASWDCMDDDHYELLSERNSPLLFQSKPIQDA